MFVRFGVFSLLILSIVMSSVVSALVRSFKHVRNGILLLNVVLMVHQLISSLIEEMSEVFLISVDALLWNVH